MENKQRICEICNKRFANGKAMGGHMRSHLAKLPVPPKPTNIQTPPYSYVNISTPPPPKPAVSSSSSLVSCRSSSKTQVHYFSHHRSVSNHERINFPKSSSLDTESETESSPRNPTRRRSKRRRRWESPPRPQESGGFSDEEVAMWLMMLSMDKWRKNEIKEVREEYMTQDFDDRHDDDEDDDELLVSIGGGKSQKEKYKCETCNKIFRSYQALGGHRASHKNKKIKICFKGVVEEREEEDQSGFVRGFECPFCDKVFESGQALGGHKKIHLPYLGITNPRNIHNNNDYNINDSDNLLDLNLPAEPEEEEDDDDDEEISAVSDQG